VALTYFNAGLRIYDISDPTDAKEIAYFVPARTGDIEKWDSWRRADVGVYVEWDRNLIWVSTGFLGNPEGEILCLSCSALGKLVLELRLVTRWSVPHLNAGWDDQTSKPCASAGVRSARVGDGTHRETRCGWATLKEASHARYE
jgi:hypothetical protein